MYKFSERSNERLDTCRHELQKVFRLAIQRSGVDFGISEGQRSVKRQQELYAKGRTEKGEIVTYVDGVNKRSKHNYIPSEAVDIYAFVNGSASWETKHLCYLAGVIMACANELNVDLTWGGNWDNDGQIISDQNFVDLPHFETR